MTTTARWFHPGRARPVRLIGVHTMESPEMGTTAESCERYFATTDRKASAHLCVDNNSTARSVDDTDTAFTAKGANADGLHIELAGRASQTPQQWADAYSVALLSRAARDVASWCRAYDIPPVRLTVDQVRDGGSRGICGHADIDAAFPSTGHTDPGRHFPWPTFLVMVRQLIPTPAPEDDMPVIAKVTGQPTAFLTDLLTAKRSLDNPAEVAALKAIGIRDVGDVPAELLADVPQVAG